MTLSNKQEQALKIALARYRGHEPYTIIAGYSGTGKSTLIRFIVSALNLDPLNDVAYIAYTGKAAQVLKDKGNPNAKTAHRLLYRSIEKPDGSFIHIPRTTLEADYKLIVVDELSMIPEDIWDLLLSHHIHVIATGDPGQLPAITKTQNILDTPHIFLDEIVRQAEDNEIIRIGHDIRQGKPLKPYQGSNVMILPANALDHSMYLWANQIICGTNSQRQKINRETRELIFGDDVSDLPQINDKIICCHNRWGRVTEYGDALVNGTGGIITSLIDGGKDKWLGENIYLDFLPDGIPIDCAELGTFKNLLIDYNYLLTGAESKNKDNFKIFPKHLKPELFAYGYCITCWKAQGSEWDKVLLVEEKFPYDKEQRIKFLYTAFTRAKEKIVVIQKD